MCLSTYSTRLTRQISAKLSPTIEVVCMITMVVLVLLMLASLSTVLRSIT